MNVSDWAWADGNCPVIWAYYQSALFNFPHPFWKRGHSVGSVWVLPGMLLLSWLRRGMDMKWLCHPSVVFQMWKPLSLFPVALDRLWTVCGGNRNPKQAVTSWSFLSAQNFVAFTQSRAQNFPIWQNVRMSRLLDPLTVLWLSFLHLRNSSFKLRQPCSNCNAWCLSNTLLKTGLVLE